MVDDWRRRQKDLPSRAEAIRRLVETADKATNNAGAGQLKRLPSAVMSQHIRAFDAAHFGRTKPNSTIISIVQLHVDDNAAS